MQEKLKALEGEARGAIEEAASLEEVEALRVRYLGRKGKLTSCGHEGPAPGAPGGGKTGQ